MRIHLEQIEEEPFRWDRSETAPEWVLERPDLLAISGIRWSGSVARASSGWRLQAVLRYLQTLSCSRCTQPREEKVETDLDLYVVISPPQPLGGEVELEESDLGVLALDDELLDTDPILHEQLELNIPMSTLCKEDCAGLCPRCGADRNANPDCCEGAEIDPRWQVLKDITTN